jgi:hypothetical protein
MDCAYVSDLQVHPVAVLATFLEEGGCADSNMVARRLIEQCGTIEDVMHANEHWLSTVTGDHRIARLIRAASALPPLSQNDAEREAEAHRLDQLTEEVSSLALRLDDFVRASPAEGAECAEVLSAGRVRNLIRARRLREKLLGNDLFADPAWDIILDLMAARLSGERVSVSSLCIAAAVPPTTAMRWVALLTDRGMLERQADPGDGRRVFVSLSDQAADIFVQWYDAVHGSRQAAAR